MHVYCILKNNTAKYSEQIACMFLHYMAGRQCTSMSVYSVYFSLDLMLGIARTQIPPNKNYALEFPITGEIADLSFPEVQWEGLNLERQPG